MSPDLFVFLEVRRLYEKWQKIESSDLRFYGCGSCDVALDALVEKEWGERESNPHDLAVRGF